MPSLQYSKIKITNAHKSSGFTLLEILLAIGITAMIGISTYTLLSQTLRTRDHLSDQTERLRDFQLAATVIQNDLRQISSRVIRDQFGDHQSTIIVGEYNINGFLEFTRNGVSNPLKLKKSNFQRISYKVEDEALIRLTWNVLDQASDTEPREQTLLEGIIEAEVKVWDKENNEWLTQWPRESQNNPTVADKAILPDGISMEIITDNGQVYRWVEQL